MEWGSKKIHWEIFEERTKSGRRKSTLPSKPNDFCRNICFPAGLNYLPFFSFSQRRDEPHVAHDERLLRHGFQRDRIAARWRGVDHVFHAELQRQPLRKDGPALHARELKNTHSRWVGFKRRFDVSIAVTYFSPFVTRAGKWNREGFQREAILLRLGP